jgi:hypothetical protein
VIQSIHFELEKISPAASLLFAAMASNKIDSIYIPRASRRRASLPAPLATVCAPRFTAGLTRLHISSYSINDAFLKSLSTSPASQTLRSIALPSAEVSDASAAVWQHFHHLASLNLDWNDQITDTTLVELSKHSNIEELSLSYLRRCATYRALELLLHPQSLPLLSSLDVRYNLCDEGLTMSTEDSLARDFVEWIERREQTRERIRAIRAGFNMSDHLVKRVMMLCPNLEHALHLSPHLSELSSMNCANITELRIPRDGNQNFDYLFTACPHLGRLDVGMLMSATGHRFDGALSLRQLCCEFSASLVAQNGCWPPNLEVLKIVTCPVTRSDAELMEWLISLRSACPKLRSLRIHFAHFEFAAHHIQVLAESFTNLEELEVPISVGKTDAPALAFGKLQKSTNSSNFKIAYAPELTVFKRLIASEFDVQRVCGIARASMPRLQRVSICKNQYWGASATEMDDMLDSIRSISALTTLTLKYPLESYQIDQIAIFSRLSALCLMTELSETSASLKGLLEALPCLSKLKLVHCGTIDSISTFKHAFLSELIVDHITLNEDLRITSEQFPSLAAISFSNVTTEAIALLNLQKLRQVRIGSANIARRKAITIENNCLDLVTHFSYEYEGFSAINSIIPPSHRLTMKGPAIKVADISITDRTLTDIILDFDDDDDDPRFE